MRKHERFLQVCGLVFLHIATAVGFALGADITLVPSVRVQAEYDDNIVFARDTNFVESDYRGIVSPSFLFNYATQRLRLDASGTMDILRYLDTDELDDEFYYGRFNVQYQLTERFSLLGNLGYTEDATTRTELQETGTFFLRENRKRKTAGAGATYRVSETSEITGNYSYSDVNYERFSVDFKNHSAVISYNRQLSPRDVFTIQPTYYHYDSDVSTVDSPGLSFGWSHAFTELFSLRAFLGARYTKTEFEVAQVFFDFDPIFGTITPIVIESNETTTNWAGTADISVNKQGELYSLTFGFKQDLTYSSVGEPLNTSRFYGNFQRRMTERFSVGVDGSFYVNRPNTNLSDYFDFDRRYFSLRPFLNYRLTENHFLEASYRYQNSYDDDVRDNKTADRNQIWIAVNFRFPRKW
jgi:hypothetical protein